MTSIRTRLLVWLAGGLLLLFSVTGVAVYRVVEDRVRADAVSDLQAKAEAILAGVHLGIAPDSEREVERLGALAMENSSYAPGTRKEALAALRKLAATAVRIRSSLSLDPLGEPEAPDAEKITIFEVTGSVDHPQGGDSQFVAVTNLEDPAESIRFHAFDAVDWGLDPEGNAELRVMAYKAVVDFEDAGWAKTWRDLQAKEPELRRGARVLIKRTTLAEQRLLTRVAGGLIAGGLGLAVLIVLTTWLVLRRGLAPLASLSEQVGALRADALEQRVGEADLPRELLPIARRLNEALARIEGSVERERRTAGHIAHELRTPIAELMSINEIARRWPEDPELQARAVGDSHEVAVHMGRVVNALLKVARAGAGTHPLTPEPVRLGDLTARACETLASAAADRQQTLATDQVEEVSGETDPDIAEAIVASLLKNAIQHAPQGSTITLGTSAPEGSPVLWIENPAPELSEDDLGHLAEAFWRKDAARTSSDEGGLGLTLAFELCRTAGIEVTPTLRDGAFRLTLGFPRHAA